MGTIPELRRDQPPTRVNSSFMSSFFVEQAAREAQEAPCLPGQEEADFLLARARQRIYHWPADFAGFSCRLVFSQGESTVLGSLTCRGSRALGLTMPGVEDTRWLSFQLEELVSHREAPEVSRIASKTGCRLGDWDEVYGRRIDFLGDKMGSFYRIKDDRLCQIGRSYRSENLLLTIDSHQCCGGRWAAEYYSAYYWSQDGPLSRAETYLDRYQEVGGLFLPAERRVTEASRAGLRVRRLLFEEPCLY